MSKVKQKKESLTAPGSREDLKEFLKEHLNLVVPDVRVCGHHAAPMDYLWHAYRADSRYKNQRSKIKDQKSKIKIVEAASLRLN